MVSWKNEVIYKVIGFKIKCQTKSIKLGKVYENIG